MFGNELKLLYISSSEISCTAEKGGPQKGVLDLLSASPPQRDEEAHPHSRARLVGQRGSRAGQRDRFDYLQPGKKSSCFYVKAKNVDSFATDSQNV